MSQEGSVKYKVVTIGNTNVGKTSLLSYAMTNRFDPDLQPTVGGGHMEMKVEVGGQIVSLSLWDTAGSEKFRAIVPMYFHETSVALFVFDITKEETFLALPDWEDLVQEAVPSTMQKIVVGNKCDLESERQVSTEQGNNYAEKCGALMYIETSARTGIGVEDLFRRIASGQGLTPQESNKENRLVETNTEPSTKKTAKQCC